MANQMEKRRKRLIIHLSSVLKKLGKDLNVDPCDVSYALRRLDAEGPSFLTKTLPLYSAYALQCVTAGHVLSPRVSGLTHFAWKGKSPSFLGGFLKKSIEGCASSLGVIRQFCDYFYKFAFAFSEDDLRNAEKDYMSTEENLAKQVNKAVSDPSILSRYEEIRVIFERLFPKLVTMPTWRILDDGTRDGPGAFAGSDDVKRVYNIPYEQYKKLPAYHVGSCHTDMAGHSGYFKSYPGSPEVISVRHAEKTCEVRFVPKDSRGPRVISKEPYLLLKAQMAFNDFMSRELTRLSGGRINFADQTINQNLSKVASIDGINATIDLKSASDRVSRYLVSCIFRNTSGLREIAHKCRSTHCLMPSGKKVELVKFANMGSGLCFPVLSLVVYLVATFAISRALRTRDYKRCSEMVYVYGDDLIIPCRFISDVSDALETFGLEMNLKKSFAKGYFRESCGADYYRGYDVTPVRLKLTGGRFDTIDKYRNGCVPITEDAAIVQLNMHARELEKSGLTALADFYYRQQEKILGELPYVEYECAALGKYKANQIVPYADTTAYLVYPQFRFVLAVSCPYKRLGFLFKSGTSSRTGRVFDRTALRHALKLKKGLLVGAARTGSGVPDATMLYNAL